MKLKKCGIAGLFVFAVVMLAGCWSTGTVAKSASEVSYVEMGAREFIDKVDNHGYLEDWYQEKKAAEEKAKAEKLAAKDAKAKEIAKRYTYHGIDKATENNRLFANGALEEGHAYYVSDFVISKYSNDAGAVIISLFGGSNDVYVKYVRQKVKGEVVGASKTILGNFPVDIVVTGGNGISHIPIIIGLVE